MITRSSRKKLTQNAIISFANLKSQPKKRKIGIKNLSKKRIQIMIQIHQILLKLSLPTYLDLETINLTTKNSRRMRKLNILELKKDLSIRDQSPQKLIIIYQKM